MMLTDAEEPVYHSSPYGRTMWIIPFLYLPLIKIHPKLMYRSINHSSSVTDWIGIYTCKECHKTESRWNHTTTDKEGEQLEDRRNVGENSCTFGDGTDQIGLIFDVYDDDDIYMSIYNNFICMLLKFRYSRESVSCTWRHSASVTRQSITAS